MIARNVDQMYYLLSLDASRAAGQPHASHVKLQKKHHNPTHDVAPNVSENARLGQIAEAQARIDCNDFAHRILPYTFEIQSSHHQFFKKLGY